MWRQLNHWRLRGFESPSPVFVKHACLLRNASPNETWVETGTYLGQTTEFLSDFANIVYSIEPEETLFEAARRKFERLGNVHIIKGLSEHILPDLLPDLSGSINFWLDGHFSSGVTFKGPQETPILDELSCIAQNIDRFGRLCIFIDDVRCFDPTVERYAAYPALNRIVGWAVENGFSWTIEHDIFIAKKMSEHN